MKDQQYEDTTSVRGERDSATLARAPSMQARISNFLAIGLMSILGLGMLTWYYANTLSRQAHARESAKLSMTKRTQSGDMPLPSLGRIDPPAVEMAPQDPAPQANALLATPPREVPLDVAPVATQAAAAYGASPAKTSAQLTLERELSGAVFQSSSPAAPTPPSAGMPPGSAQEPGELSALLRPSITTAVRAQVLPTQRLLLPKGAFLDCTLETAIDSTLPGMTTCVMATDTFGVDGEVVLLERGTKLVGETRGQVQQGSTRIFVLWNEARTPTGVIVPLASPGADELGRAGLPGNVDHHFWERFGAAMLVSVIDGAIQAAVQSSRGSSGTVIVNPSATQDVMTEVLKGTINIPPTVVKHQGDRIQVLVARDLDFRSVYELKSR
jgi:type IV secretion system protein VirB10